LLLTTYYLLLTIFAANLEELDNTIKVGAVSYLNTKPLLYGWKHGYEIKNAVLIEDYPARIADLLLKNEIDVGLVPVSIIPKLKEHYIISDYCIGAVGRVATVGIYSEVPLEKVETILLDYQSRTSVALAKILLKDYWKLSPVFVKAGTDFRNEINGTTAAVVIGDRAFEQHNQSTYSYDLAEAWINFTGLPFVFAAWVSNKKLPESFIAQFNEANRIGLQHIDKVVEENESPGYDLKKYFTENISYQWSEEMKLGFKRFLELMDDTVPVKM
jgi:chorismate dehydratase